MKHNSFPTPAAPVTLQDVIDRLGAKTDLSDTRKRDLRSAIVTYSKIPRRIARRDPNGSRGDTEDARQRRAAAGQGVPQTVG